MVYALLDDQPDARFIKTSTLKKLNVSAPEVHVKLSTVLAEEDITSEKIAGLVVRGVNKSTNICLPRTYKRDIIPVRSLGLKPHVSGHTYKELLTILCRVRKK